MSVFELSMEELKKYQGRNPRPEDFDDYWENALEEMREVNAEIELERARFQTENVECMDMYFTGVKRARIHVKYCRPVKTLKKHPAVLKFHGYTDNAGTWTDMLSYAAGGFSVFSMDCRGQGGYSEDLGSVRGTTMRGHIIRGLDDGKEALLYRSIFLDAAKLASIVMEREEVDENRVGAFGGSQGGALALVCAALEPRVKRVSSLYPFLSDYKRVWEMDLAKNPYEELSYYFRWFDPCHERQKDIFERLGYIDVQNFAERIQGEVMMGTGMMDMNCPPSSQFAVYNKIRSVKTHVIYPDFRHENIPDYIDRTYQFMSKL